MRFFFFLEWTEPDCILFFWLKNIKKKRHTTQMYYLGEKNRDSLSESFFWVGYWQPGKKVNWMSQTLVVNIFVFFYFTTYH